VAESRGANELAREQFEEAAELLRQLGETRWVVLALTHLGGAYRDLGDPQRARLVQQEALELAVGSGDVRGAAVVRNNMAYLLIGEGEDGPARALLEEALEGARTISDTYMIASCLASLATIALRAGELEKAGRELRGSIEQFSSIGDTRDLAVTIAEGSEVVLALGDVLSSVRLCAAAEAIGRLHGFEFDPAAREAVQRVAAAGRRELGEAFDEAWSSGEQLELEATVELALRALGGRPLLSDH
jgi:tetratricopeptide (TPR) repeat protein